jgi:hypothetical protein
MTSVFEKAQIAGITLRNRILRSATHEGMGDDKGRPTETLIRKYTALANGGVGAIITGFDGVQQNGRAPGPGMLMLDSDENIDSFGHLVDQMHALNTPIILQLVHCGRQTRSKVTGEPVVAPSAIRHKVFDEDSYHETEKNCMGGCIGCVQCKKNLAAKMAETLTPIYERRQEILKKPGYIREVLENGNENARKIALKTMCDVRKAMKIDW